MHKWWAEPGMYDLAISQAHFADCSLKFGVWIPPYPHWPRIQRAAQKIEELGFDSIWVFDQCANQCDQNADRMEAWTCLAGIAACTNRIGLGSLVNAVMCHDPAQLARQALTLDHISRGRLTLGFDAGSAESGKETGGRSERRSRIEERVRNVDQLLRNQEASSEGKGDQAEGAEKLPRPVQRPRPPLMVAGQGPDAAGTAARYADVWHMQGWIRETQVRSLTKAAECTAALYAAARSAGRDPDTIRRAHCLGWTEMDLYAGIGLFQDIVVPLVELGFTEFMLDFRKESDSAPLAPIRHLPDEEALEWIAKAAIPSLRSVVQAL